MSGMDLLLQAAALRPSALESEQPKMSLPPKKRMKLSQPKLYDCATVSVSSSIGALSRSCSSSGSVAPTVNSDWSVVDAQAAHRKAWRNALELAAARADASHVGREIKAVTKPTNNKHFGKKRRATIVKDVDGHELGMGYFSALAPPSSQERASPAVSQVSVAGSASSVTSSSSSANAASLASSVETTSNQCPPVSTVFAKSRTAAPSLKKTSSQIDNAEAAKAMLFKAYLAALKQHQPGAGQ